MAHDTTKTRTITGIMRLSRMPSSRDGNPRYAVYLDGIGHVGSTSPDSSLAYGRVPNSEGRRVSLTVRDTRRGTYVADCQPAD